MKRLFLLFVLFGAVGVSAQGQQENQTEQDDQSGGSVLDTELTEEELAAAENNDLVLEGDEGEGQEETSSRFIPTEQISQDLGVSFPVDI